MYVITATATISGCLISGNAVSSYGSGGGVYLGSGATTLRGNVIISNTATVGGGVYLYSGAATLSGNTVAANSGSGVYLAYYSDATLNGNTVVSNTATYGGGVDLYLSNATLSGNTVSGNIASWGGGGVCLDRSDATLRGNTIVSNTASWGGGVYLDRSDATLDNEVIADNSGGGVYIIGSRPVLRHATVARNGGAGVWVTDYYGTYSRVALTNTILVSHTVGITVTDHSAATLEGTLWGSGAWANGTDWGGAGAVTTGTVNLWDDPGFVNPAAGDYHIRSDSAAVDAGVDSGVTTDIDGDPRPLGKGYDIGADEWNPSQAYRVYLPLVLRNR